MFPRASRIRPRRIVGLLALASALALFAPAAQARSTDRTSSTRQTAAVRTAPAEAGLLGRFLNLLKAIWQAEGTAPTGSGGSSTTTTPPEGSGIDPHGVPPKVP